MSLPRARRSFKYCARKYWQLYLFLLLPIVYLIVFKYVPMVGVQIAFRRFSSRLGMWKSPYVGFSQFTRFFQSYQFERVLTNTIRLSLYSMVAGFPLPIIMALALNTLRSKRYRSLVENVIYMPHFISTVVMVGILFQVFNSRIGLFATVWKALVGGDVPNYFGSPSAFTHLYVWSGVWQGMGWNTVIYTAALANVDPQQHEAALIDGATRFQRLLRIDLPAIVPSIAITLILRCGKLMDIGFDKVYLMQNDLNIRSSQVIATYTYEVGLSAGGGDFSYATAIGLFNSVVNLMMLLIVNFVSKRVSESSLW